MKSVGIDLSGKEENPTGLSIQKDREVDSETVYRDDSIVERCKTESPDIIAIDAPLAFPQEGWLRKCDKEMINKGYRVLPPELGGMKYLTKRGIKLAEQLEELRFEVIEVHPLTSGRILFDSKDREKWVSKLLERGWNIDTEMNEHETDSMAAAITGFLYLRGKTRNIGEGKGVIVIPVEGLTVP